MHRVDAVNRERIASHNVGRVGHGDGLVAVVHVDLAADRGRGGLRHVLGLSASGVNRGYSTSNGDAVRIVKFVGVKTSDHPDLIALVSEVRFRVAEGASCHRQVAGHAVIVAAGQAQEAVVIRNALLVHDRVAQAHVVIVTGGANDRNNQRALSGCGVHDRHVDVRSQLLLGGLAQAALLQRISQVEGRHGPRHRLAEADGAGNRQLGHVLVRDGRAGRGGLRLGDVGHRAPDGVVGTSHHRLVGVVDRDVTRQHQQVLEAFKNVFERYALFF